MLEVCERSQDLKLVYIAEVLLILRKRTKGTWPRLCWNHLHSIYNSAKVFLNVTLGDLPSGAKCVTPNAVAAGVAPHIDASHSNAQTFLC